CILPGAHIMKQLILILSILSLAACEPITADTDNPSMDDGTGGGNGDATGGGNGDGTGGGNGDSTGGGNGDSTGGGNDDGTGGGNGDGTDGGTACVVPSEISEVNPTFRLVSNFGGGDEPPDYTQWVGTRIPLDDSATPDLLDIDVFKGYGVFTEALQIGTFEITGAETSYADCGACIAIFGDHSPELGSDHMLMAQSGTLTIDSLPAATGGRYAGSIENVTLSEVVYDPAVEDYAVVPGGCQSTIERWSFDVTVGETPGAPAPQPQP
ncbi:MAG: hypothetical protein AAGC55_33815, partial [Myxococcota bacterium]